MTNARRATTLAAALTLVCAVTGCADDPAEPLSAQPTPPSSSPLPPRTSANTPTSDSERAAAAAESVVRDYFAVVDRLRQRPKEPLVALKAVATSGELAAGRRLVQTERREGLKQVGDTRITELKVQSVNLDNSDPKSGKVPTVQVEVCWNVNAVDVIDGTGRSVVSQSRPDSGWIRFDVANYRWSKDPLTGWRVASSRDLEQAPCAAS